MAFHDVLFPPDISYSSSGGPGFNTTVIELASGHEKRNVNWQEQRAKYDVSHGIKTRAQMEDLLEFFYARRAKGYAFRFKDWMDFEIVDQILGIGDAATTAFQFFKRYEGDTQFYFDRPIRKLVPGTVEIEVLVEDEPVVAPYTIDHNTGILTFTTAPAAGAQIMIISAEFHVPVRFDIDDVTITHDDWETMSWPSIPLVETKED